MERVKYEMPSGASQNHEKRPFTRVSAFVRRRIVAAQWETHLGIFANPSDDIPIHSSPFGIMTAADENIT
jgi:hypothetical protein